MTGRILRVLTAVAVLVSAGVVAGPAQPASAAANPAFSTSDLPNPPAPPGSPVVALTFDDGPSPNITPAVLDTLAAYGAHATFFVVGDFAARYPDLLRRAVAMGNSVQLHTMHHATLTRLSAAGIAADAEPRARRSGGERSGQRRPRRPWSGIRPGSGAGSSGAGSG